VETLLRVGDREHDDHVGHRSVGDEGLAAVEAPAALAALGSQAHGEGVRTRIGFGDGVRTDQCAVAQTAQVTVLLRLAAMLPDGHDAGQDMGADRKDQAAIAAAVAQRLEGDGAGQRVGTAATVRLRHRQAEQADGGALAPEFARKKLAERSRSITSWLSSPRRT
jgi:hypothetical protein